MASIENREVLRRIEKECFTSPAAEATPKQLSNTVVPVIVSNPKNYARVLDSTIKAVTGADLFYKTSATKETYVTAVTVGLIKDVANDAATGAVSLYVKINNVSVPIVSIPIITLTAQAAYVTLNFDTPIKCDKDTDINFGTTTYTAGVMVRTATVMGYEVDAQ